MAGLDGVSTSTTVAARPHESETLHDGKAGEDGPDEEAKGNSSLGRLAECVAAALGDADEVGHSDGASEPENGGDAEQDEADEAVVETRGEERHQRKVEQDEDGPDGAEEHEGEG